MHGGPNGIEPLCMYGFCTFFAGQGWFSDRLDQSAVGRLSATSRVFRTLPSAFARKPLNVQPPKVVELQKLSSPVFMPGSMLLENV